MKYKKIKRILGIFLTMLLVVGLLPSATLTVKAADATTIYDNADTSWWNGAHYGTISDPYIINDEGDLLGLAKLCNLQSQNFNGKYITLNADIDISDITNWPGIGNYSTTFFGSFDGNNHTISGMRINSAAYQYAGLFTQAAACTIKNVKLMDVNINAPDATLIGGIIAYVGSSGNTPATIDHCSISGIITVSGSEKYPNIAHAGGIVGQAAGTVTISNCTNNATVTGPVMNTGSIKFFGGIVATIQETNSTVTINECGNTGTVSGGSYTGGIVGNCSVASSSITACYNSGTVSAGLRVGGIAGSVLSPITKCFNSGIVSAAVTASRGTAICAIGGIAGFTYAAISSSYSTGTVSATDNSTDLDYAGGIAGAMYSLAAPLPAASMSSCYAGGGTVTSPDSSAAGGVVGYQNGGTVTNCFFDTERTGLAYADAKSSSSTGALLTADMTSENVITTGAMAALGATDWVRKIYNDSYNYYPELVIFEGLHIAEASVKVIPQLVLSVSPSISGTSLSVTLSRAGTVHYVIVTGNATVPSAEQIIAGTDYSGITVLAHGSQASDSNGAISIALDGDVSNFTSGNYSVYAVGTDADGVKTAVFPALALSIQTDNVLAFGVKDYVTGLEPIAAAELTDGEFTVEFELKTPSDPIQDKYNYLYVDGGAGYGIVMHNSRIGYTSGSNEYYSADTLQAGTWYHIAVVCKPTENKQISIYIDGIDKGIKDGYHEDQDQLNVLPYYNAVMGDQHSSDLQGCVLDNFKVWNYAAADAAAIHHMAETTTGSSLLRYYDFNQGVANGNNSGFTSLPDKSSYATASGTLNGFDLSGDDSNWVKKVVSIPTFPLITLSPEGNKFFGVETLGYTTLSPYSITVKNTGTAASGELTLALSGTNASDFILSKTSISSIAVNSQDSFTVVPNMGLSVGSYTAVVTVTGSSITAQSFEVSFVVTDILQTVPGAATNVIASPENGQASITFMAPADNGGSPITGYIVTSTPGNVIAQGTGTSITVAGLTNGTAYTFTVKAVNAVGNSVDSAASNSVTPYSPSNGGNTDNPSSIIYPSPSPSPAVEKITVDVKQGNTDSTVSQITIERSTGKDGKKTDTVTYQEDKTVETIKKLKEENKDTARIVIPDKKDEVSETKVNISSKSISALSEGEINLQIDTEEAKIDISKNTIKNISNSTEEDLYFQLVPIKDEPQKEAVAKRALLQAGMINGNTEGSISVLGNPVTIETNMTSSEADITLPLTDIIIPADQQKRAAFLKQLAVYIEHSDGDKELVQGELVEFKDGIYGIRFHITKFSTFTLVKTDAFLQSSACDILKITAPSKVAIKGSNMTATQANKVSNIQVKAIVSDKAVWELYKDKACTQEVANLKLKLKVGSNTAYIKVIAEDGTFKVYKLTMIRSKSSEAEITKVIIPEMAIIKDKTITAIVANEKASLVVKATVSDKAAWKLYSDKACTKELADHKLSLKEGSNTLYLKVIAEDQKTSKVYIIKITRKGADKVLYNAHIKLGLIGSKTYAERIAKVFEQDYDGTSITVKKEGKYYRVYVDFTDKAAATKACKDMANRNYIVNYYFY